MKRVLITGATGFVGANLTRRLLQEGQEVHLLVRQGFDPWRTATIADHVHFHEIDFNDLATLKKITRLVRPDWVFHLAAYGAYSHQTNVQRIIQTNITGTVNLLEACLAAGFEAFVNTGSSSEYGFKDHAPAENESVEPNSYYAIAKLSATHFCRHIARSKNVYLPTLRLYSVYGPYEEPTRLIPTLICHALRGELPPLVAPEIARDYVYIDDITEAYILAATNRTGEPGAIYNVGTGIQTNLSEVVTVAKDILPISEEPHWGSMSKRLWDSDIWVASNDKIQKELGWQPHYTFREGFRATVNWLKNDETMSAFYEQRQKVE